MNDFETHPRGTFDEIRASRKLANAIELLSRQYGHSIIPNDIWKAYQELCAVYNKHMMNGDV
jgi:hypothetical protein